MNRATLLALNVLAFYSPNRVFYSPASELPDDVEVVTVDDANNRVVLIHPDNVLAFLEDARQFGVSAMRYHNTRSN